MNKNINHSMTLQISGYDQLKKLRTALAISQGTKLLSMLQQEADRTVSHDQSKRVTYLTGLFSRIHREMFHHWKEQATVSHRPGTMTDPDKRRKFRETIERLVLDDDDNKDFLVPTYCKGGELYIGLENVEKLQQVSLLIQVLEGSIS